MIHYSCTSWDRYKAAPKSCDVYTSSAFHYETKGIRINPPLLLEDFEFSSLLWTSIRIAWVYQKSTLKTPKPAIQESTSANPATLPKVITSSWNPQRFKTLTRNHYRQARAFFGQELLFFLNQNFRTVITLDPKKPPIVGFFGGNLQVCHETQSS